jgi:hypothetical protein
MRWDQIAEFGAGGAVSLAGAFDCAVEHVAGNEREDNGMPPQGRVPAVFGKQVEQPGNFPGSYVSSSVEVGVPGEWRWLVSWRLGRAV